MIRFPDSQRLREKAKTRREVRTERSLSLGFGESGGTRTGLTTNLIGIETQSQLTCMRLRSEGGAVKRSVGRILDEGGDCPRLSYLRGAIQSSGSRSAHISS